MGMGQHSEFFSSRNEAESFVNGAVALLTQEEPDEQQEQDSAALLHV